MQYGATIARLPIVPSTSTCCACVRRSSRKMALPSSAACAASDTVSTSKCRRNSYNKNPGAPPGHFMFDWLFTDPLLPGTPAPDFSLPDQDGKIVSLSALRGHNVVVVFYPGDDTSVCRQQLCEFRDRWSDAREKNTLVYGVNPQS